MIISLSCGGCDCDEKWAARRGERVWLLARRWTAHGERRTANGEQRKMELLARRPVRSGLGPNQRERIGFACSAVCGGTFLRRVALMRFDYVGANIKLSAGLFQHIIPVHAEYFMALARLVKQMNLLQ